MSSTAGMSGSGWPAPSRTGRISRPRRTAADRSARGPVGVSNAPEVRRHSDISASTALSVGTRS
ncbi:hypothetical protein [Nonomuraea dietziae]|uniref:hypothetical protein n=1 Tax=Nonomuraea dietziae TaxID=65515 RepID=UPI0031DDD8F2